MIDFIKYKGRNYKIRQLFDANFGVLNIASTIFESKLIVDGQHKSIEAQNLDEMIYFYIEPNQFKLSDCQLINLLKSECL